MIKCSERGRLFSESFSCVASGLRELYDVRRTGRRGQYYILRNSGKTRTELTNVSACRNPASKSLLLRNFCVLD